MKPRSKIKKELIAKAMKSRMTVAVCSDGRKRNVLKKRTELEQIAAFWEKVKKGNPDECWPWLGAVTGSSGKYGHVYFRGKIRKAHRVSYELAFGAIPPGFLACHKCDNRICVNPNHIFIGTQKDNLADMVRKGRANPGVLRGEDSPRCKINLSQVIKAKELSRKGVMQKEIARITGISKTNVGSIVQGRSWGHVHLPPLVNA